MELYQQEKHDRWKKKYPKAHLNQAIPSDEKGFVLDEWDLEINIKV